MWIFLYSLGMGLLIGASVICFIQLVIVTVQKLKHCLTLLRFGEGWTLYVQASCGYDCTKPREYPGRTHKLSPEEYAAIAEFELDYPMPARERIDKPRSDGCVCDICCRVRGATV